MRDSDFSKIYSDHREMVWKLVSRYVSGQHDREDLFQEVFVRVHKALPKFRGDSGIGSWIYRIAVNTSLNHLRKMKLRKGLSEALGMLALTGHQEDFPAEQDGSALLRPLEKLNPRQRMILILSDVEERKLSEIAEMLNMSVGTVKSSLHRAREIVRKEVEKNG